MSSLVRHWTKAIKAKSWRSADNASLGPANHLINLLNQVLPAGFFKKQLTFGDKVPPGFQFLYNLQNNIVMGRDGYDDFQAPMVKNKELFRRRMWVQGKYDFGTAYTNGEETQKIGQELWCNETIPTVRSLNEGESVFVTIERDFGAVKEFRSLVYTNKQYELPLSSGGSEGKESEWLSSNGYNEVIGLNELHRMNVIKYSFLTYNVHKIHLDQAYAELEGLPDLIVQGPYLATILLQLCPPKGLVGFNYKNVQPCFVGEVPMVYIKREDKEIKLVMVDGSGSKRIIEGVASYDKSTTE
ncbi:uncharacterized protein KQ657_003073 [Scheffersomyces spartinae]|uniref:Uncharacterized protein n=1 Tax=Scheffersomyces spartinae TaxID=45513 RepID=A0A9P7V510_9ASCO|nr:uncharacterized protein KQ657_003073 [Scheffersomyces spartinae]KAG7191478.1 hypothetical protein KQ657_003073 [Scheffersomyces spartinae]